MTIDRTAAPARRAKRPVYTLTAWLLLAVAAPAPAWRPGLLHTGHEPDVDPALRRFTGVVVAVAAPDASGLVRSFRLQPIGPGAVPPQPDELKGWRLTVLAGQRFGQVYRVQANTPQEITVRAVDGSLQGLAASDVFVVEQVGDESAPPNAGLPMRGMRMVGGVRDAA